MSGPTSAQIDALLNFLEEHRELAKGSLRSIDGRTLSHRLWDEIRTTLNAMGGCTKTTKQWQKVWTDKKHLAKKAAGEARRSASATGGGPSTAPSLSQWELKIVSIMGDGFGESQTSARTQAFVEQPSQDTSTAAPTSIQLNQEEELSLLIETQTQEELSQPASATPAAAMPTTRSQLTYPQSCHPTNSVSALADISKTQDAFNTLSLLMLVNYLFPKQAKLKDGNRFDFLIVGGGTAGCVLANRLAAANHTVLLLEAGTDEPYDSFLPGALVYLPKSGLDWNLTATPDKYTGRCHRNPAMAVPVGKVLGGSSSIGFMLGLRGIVHDYHKWAEAVNDSSWEYNNLLPYFKRSERLQAPKIANSATGNCRGVGGTPPDFGVQGGAGNIGIAQDNSTNIEDLLKSFKEMGNEIVQDLSGTHSVGYSRALYTIAEGYRQSTAYGYLVPAKKYPNLFLSKNTLVTKIIFDKNKNAIGVRASINGKKEIFFRANKEVILSAGVIYSPHLLMLSGIGPRKHLKEKNIKVIADLPVGENFQDQQVVTVLHRAKKIADPGPFNFHTYPASAVVGYKPLEPCSKVPDYATITFIEERNYFFLQFCTLPFNLQYDICDRSYDQLMGRQNTYTQIVNLYPKSRGKVTLKTKNPHDAPMIDTGYFSKKEDINNLVKYLKDFLPIVNTTYFKDVNGSIVDPIGDKCSDFKYGTDDYWKCYVYCMSTSMWNYGGTCSMGSVVDPKLKVYGIKRLRVVDASVLSFIVTGGNFVATVVIAEKASDMINEEHQGN